LGCSGAFCPLKKRRRREKRRKKERASRRLTLVAGRGRGAVDGRELGRQPVDELLDAPGGDEGLALREELGALFLFLCFYCLEGEEESKSVSARNGGGERAKATATAAGAPSRRVARAVALSLSLLLSRFFDVRRRSTCPRRPRSRPSLRRRRRRERKAEREGIADSRERGKRTSASGNRPATYCVTATWLSSSYVSTSWTDAMAGRSSCAARCCSLSLLSRVRDSVFGCCFWGGCWAALLSFRPLYFCVVVRGVEVGVDAVDAVDRAVQLSV
jgi:hypothetical protein